MLQPRLRRSGAGGKKAKKKRIFLAILAFGPWVAARGASISKDWELLERQRSELHPSATHPHYLHAFAIFYGD
jgi:hypothetical protein